MKLKHFFIALILLVSGMSVMAGNDGELLTPVHGVVVDEKGEPLAGVSIQVPGSKEVIYSDFEGKFEIKIPKTGKINLKISSVSYSETQVQVEAGKTRNSSEIVIRLEEKSIL